MYLPVITTNHSNIKFILKSEISEVIQQSYGKQND